jgi:hypothetical protein
MSRRRDGERGAVMMLTAFIALGSMMMVGLVVDLGQLRVDRRTNKGVADIAARAGVGRLAFGPWSGVCKAREFLLGNAKGFSSFDSGSETWSNAEALVYGSSPCPAVVSSPDVNPCKPNLPSSWAKLQATAGNGRFTIEIQSGYALPDPRFAVDTSLGDAGAADQGSCDNLAVIISERQAPSFAQVGGGEATVVRTRSVGRLNSTESLEFIAALQLLERTKCDVLSVSGANTRVVAQPFNAYPGTIQIDSAGPSGSCQSPILNAGSGPSVVACSANSTLTACRPGIGDRPSRVGVYAANFNRPATDISTAYGTHYGDTKVMGSPRTGRKYTDERYRQNVHTLDQEAESMLTGNGGLPPGCTSVVLLTSTCIGNGITWLVVQALDCGALGTFFADLTRAVSQYIWFNCDLNVSSALTLSAANAVVVVTGQLSVSSAFTITDPRKVYVGGRDSGNKIGLDLSSPTGVFKVNMGTASACSGRTGPGHANRLVVGKGSVKVASGFTVRLCQTFTYLASGYDKVPTTDGTLPCSSPCSGYLGTINISSGSTVDLSAPNEITGRLPADSELDTTNPFEDLGLWVEAGGTANGLAGGASTRLAGVFFLPNADPFSLTGGGSLPIDLSAQFVSTSLKVTGGATVNLVPNPEDSIPVRIPNFLLVR